MQSSGTSLRHLSRTGTPQLDHIRSASEHITYVNAQSPRICTCIAGHPEQYVAPNNIKNLDLFDRPYPELTFDRGPDRRKLIDLAMQAFYWIRSMPDVQKKPSTSELLDWLQALVLGGADYNTIVTEFPFIGTLLKKNQVMNLTAITEPDQVARLHFLDSLALLTMESFREKTVIDVGCGAGIPGVPLKIGEPSMELTLLDSLRKRVDWLAETLPELGIAANCVHDRAEEYGHREEYDIAVSRAVAKLNVLAELCLPLVKVGGCFLAMKARDCDLELSQAVHGIQMLGGKVERLWDYRIPGTDNVRRGVMIRKVKATPKGYPRRYAKIQRQPL